jgi:hypothetical protein
MQNSKILMTMMMMSSLRPAESSKERERESQMISRIGVFDALFPMVLFLCGLANCRLIYEVVKLVIFMWVGVFELGMKTVYPPREIISPGFTSRVQSTSQRCAFKWYYSCLYWLTIDGGMRR